MRGCVIERKTATGESRFAIKYRLPSGQQVFKTIGSSRREAEDALSRILGRIAAEGTAFRRPQDARFDVFVERFLKDNRYRYKDSTRATYEAVLRKHLIPYWGHSKMRDGVTVESVTAYIGHSLDAGKSVATVNHSLNVLSAVCSWAVKVDVLPFNPVHRVHRLKNPHTFTREVLGAEQMTAVINYTPKGWKRNLVIVAAHTALRAGEIAALTADDIDWSANEIVVSSTVWRGRRQPMTKTGRTRRVPMSKAVQAAVGEQARASASGVLFPNSSGGYLNMSRVGGDVLKPALRRSGISLPDEQQGWMLFRHSAISLWCASGLPPVTVAEISGHRVQTLYAHYLHGVSDDRGKVAALMDEVSEPTSIRSVG